MSAADWETVLGMAQMLIRTEAAGSELTREKIADVVDRVLSINPPQVRANIDRNRLIAELEARFSVWIGRESVLSNEDDHRAWLTQERKVSRPYWSRYRQWLTAAIAEASIDALDESTDRVLGLLEDPHRTGEWSRRGLVVGHVQSGKTSHYIGLICKAADAGYKVIIVLAGMHDNLRSQTQMRLDEGLLGYESMPLQDGRELKFVGVGTVDPSLRPDTITNRSDSGDFNRAVARNFSINPGGNPLLFVVKKNARVLQNLLEWVEWAANRKEAESGRGIVTGVPLLVIDDEADHASVDTGEQAFDANGEPDPDYDPRRINGLVRKILFAFERSAYVGYTATPFANIFIHDQGWSADYGDDLFPRSFIVNLPAPSNHIGPVRMFGLDPRGEETDRVHLPLPLIRIVEDHADMSDPEEPEGWMPPRHRNGHRPLWDGEPSVPPSLSKAMLSFVLACAGRRARGQDRQHNSMLVHVTRFVSVQEEVRRQVLEELRRIQRRLRLGEGSGGSSIAGELRELWERDFMETSREVSRLTEDASLAPVRWASVAAHLEAAAGDIEVRVINGSAGDVLDYETKRETGLSVIVIGGDKLSRGLTLHNLSVSYFVRTTRMYDTLMQMGRWFGYRPGYLDLCRIYTTSDLHQWFQHITTAAEELREEFDHMVKVGGTPRDYGLKVQAHPALLVTSRVKMRHGRQMQLSFAGSVAETIVFHRDPEVITKNFEAMPALIQRLGDGYLASPSQPRPGGRTHSWENSYLWREVGAPSVLAFLGDIATHPEADKVNRELLRKFIEEQNSLGELTLWSVAVLSGGIEWPNTLLPGLKLVERSPHKGAPEQKREGKYVIRRLLSPRDEAIDLGADAYEGALRQTVAEWHEDPGRSSQRSEPDAPNGPCIRQQRPATHGLLLLYLLSPLVAEVDSDVPIVGFGLSFPASQRARKISYQVNRVFRTAELGGDL